jgi:hypothetical protein
MIHPQTYIRSTPKGLGLFAKKTFKRGEILWIIDDFDLKIPLGRYHEIEEKQRKPMDVYSYLDYKNRVIVPWDGGKYVNHSCAPNSTGIREYDNISIAMRTIHPDEEIVEDYYSYFGHFEEFPCLCGASNCRKFIRQNDSYDPGLRFSLDDIAGEVFSMPQPLLEIQSEENLEFLAMLEKYRRQSGMARIETLLPRQRRG